MNTAQCRYPIALIHADDIILRGANTEMPEGLSLANVARNLLTLFPNLAARYSADHQMPWFPSGHPLEAANWFDPIRIVDSSESCDASSPLDPVLLKWVKRASRRQSTHFIVTETYLRSVPARAMLLHLALQNCVTVYLAPLHPNREICRLLGMRPLGMYEDLGFAIRRGAGAKEDPVPDPVLDQMKQYVQHCRGSRFGSVQFDEGQSLFLRQYFRKRGLNL